MYILHRLIKAKEKLLFLYPHNEICSVIKIFIYYYNQNEIKGLANKRISSESSRTLNNTISHDNIK